MQCDIDHIIALCDIFHTGVICKTFSFVPKIKIMERTLAFDEVDVSLFDDKDDEISLFWENDEIEDKLDPVFIHQNKHLNIVSKRKVHTR